MSLIGKKLTDFNAQMYHEGEFKSLNLDDLKGNWSVLFFYPADFTFVCPTELGDMADLYEDFKKIDCEIYSVSTDTHFVHKAWADTSDTIKKIKYPMVGDPTGKLTRMMDVMIEEDGLALRGTFVINPNLEVVVEEVHSLGIGRNATELFRKVQAAQYVDGHDGEVCPAKWTPGEDTLAPSLDLVGKI